MERDTSRKTSDFSIARILGTLDDSGADDDDELIVDVEDEPLSSLDSHQRFEWLHCTRYRPPRLPSKFFLFKYFGQFLFFYCKNNYFLNFGFSYLYRIKN